MSTERKVAIRRGIVVGVILLFAGIDIVVAAAMDDLRAVPFLVAHGIGVVAGLATAWLLARSVRREPRGAGRQPPLSIEILVVVVAWAAAALLPRALEAPALWAGTGWVVACFAPMASAAWPTRSHPGGQLAA